MYHSCVRNVVNNQRLAISKNLGTVNSTRRHTGARIRMKDGILIAVISKGSNGKLLEPCVGRLSSPKDFILQSHHK